MALAYEAAFAATVPLGAGRGEPRPRGLVGGPNVRAEHPGEGCRGHLRADAGLYVVAMLNYHAVASASARLRR